jgi:hypothetical protein
MKDDYLFQKKKGMTISKAWILFLSLFIFYIIGGAIVGVLEAMGKKQENPFEVSIYISIVAVIILSLIGYFINCKELPRFKSISLLNVTTAITLAICFRIATSIIEDLPFSMIEQAQLEQFAKLSYFAVATQSIMLILFQVGVIGHGLLRNYDLTSAMLTTALVSLINFEPKSIITMILFISLLLYVYYKTASFQMVVIITAFYMFMDYFLKPFFDFKIIDSNNWRTVIIANDTAYYAILALCVLCIAIILKFISKLKPLDWRRTEVLPEF